MSEVNIADVEITVVGDDTAKVAIASLGHVSAIGVSKRDPQDKPNEDIGIQLAVGRAVRQLGRKLLADANKAVRAEAYAAEQQRIAQARTRVDKAWAEYYRDNPLSGYFGTDTQPAVTVIDGPPAPASAQLDAAKPLVAEADPEIEALLEEEEAIERSFRDVVEPDGEDDDLPVQSFDNIHEFFAFIDSLPRQI